MSVLHQLQPSFNNGEISPLLYDRVDYNKFTSSVKSGKNMFVHPQGGMSNRAGTRMLGQSKDEYVRLIPFEFSNTETYMIEFGNGYCRFYTTNGQVVTEDGLPYEIVSPFSTADLDKIRYCQSGDVMYIAWGGKPKTLTRYGHTNWQFDDYDYKNGPVSISKEYNGAVTKLGGGQKSAKFIGVGQSKATTSLSLIGVSSEDLISWDNFETDTYLLYQAKKCNNLLFSCKSSGGIYFSNDGIGWTRLCDGNQYFQIAHNGTFYLLYNGLDKLYRFSDLSNLSEITNVPFDINKINIVTFQNNLFFVASKEKNVNRYFFYYSIDSVVWNEGPETSNSKNNSIVFFNNYYFVFNYTYGFVSYYNNSFNSMGSITATNNRYVCGPAVSINGKLYCLLYTRNTSIFDLYEIIESAYTSLAYEFSLVKQTDEGTGGNFLSYNDYNFVLLGNQMYQIEDNNNLKEVNYNNNLYYIRKVVPLSISISPVDYVLSSTDYKFFEEDGFSNFSLNIKTDAASASGNVNVSGSSSSIGSDVYLTSGSWSLITSGSWKGNVDVVISYDNENWKVYRSYKSADQTAGSNYNISGSFDTPTFVKIQGSVTGTLSYVLNLEGADLSLFLRGKGFLSSSSVYVIPDKDSESFINYVLQIEGVLIKSSWGEFLSFPTEVELYQDRIEWFTNNVIDATKISNYTDFSVSTDVTEDDAISVIIKDKKINKINSAIAGSKLVVFTDSGNFIHNNDTFTPNSATFLKQGSTGGADVKPIVVRDNIIYAHPMKQAISDYAYSFETDGYAGQDITILANHLFENKKIKTLAYQQEPYSIIWVLQEEGSVLACTYLRQQNVIAWTPMDFGGKVLSIGVLSNGSNEELYLAVQRKNGTFVEKMPTRLPNADPKERFFVDCGRTYRGEPANIISGLEYLEGEKVVALADGNVVKDLVVANGQITLKTPASVVNVGLPYESVLETLTFDVNSGDGSQKNRKKRVVAVSVRYNNSRGTKISVNGHREVDMLKREMEGYNSPISLKSGFYREILPSAHKEPTTIKIRQDEPLPVTIVSIIPELEYEQ